MTTTRRMLANLRGVDFHADLTWDPADPFAVHMDLHTATRVVPWVVAWELLAEGRFVPAGVGDIRVRPGDPGRVEIELANPHGHAVFSLPDADVEAFLADTYCCEVPAIPDYVPVEFFQADIEEAT